MPRVNGIYSLPPIYRAENGTTIMPAQHNVPFEDVASALTQSLPRNGSAAMTNNLPMGGRKITNLAAGEVASDAARMDQLPQEMSDWLKSVSGLTMSAARFPYATSENTAALAIITAFARELTAAANAQIAREVLELKALATMTTTGTPSATNYLRGDGAWTVPPMIGVNQSWQVVTRTAGTNYQNDTGRPIMIAINGTGNNTSLYVGPTNPASIMIAMNNTGAVGSFEQYHISAVIPAGNWYRVEGGYSQVAELR